MSEHAGPKQSYSIQSICLFAKLQSKLDFHVLSEIKLMWKKTSLIGGVFSTVHITIPDILVKTKPQFRVVSVSKMKF